MAPRRCAVLFCERTVSRPSVGDRDAPEVICLVHWRLTDTRTRRIYAKAVRRSARNYALENRLWEKLKRQANERAAGITAAERPPRKAARSRPKCGSPSSARSRTRKTPG